MTEAPSARGSASDSGLLRERIALYLKVLFLIHVGFQSLTVAARLLDVALPEGPAATPLRRLAEWGLIASLGLGWWVVARRRPPRWALLACDAAVPLLLTAIYVSLTSAGQATPGLVLLVLVSLTIVLRAALVPSTVWRTALVGTLAVTGATVGGALIAPGASLLEHLWIEALGTAFVAVTVVTSFVIYNLRAEVRAVTRLGQYELKRKLGEGGMGIVYEATHVLLKRPTAVKLLPVAKAGAEALARFEQEVRQTSRLEHPNSVHIYDYGRTPDGQFYYAMEYLDGLDLAQLVRAYGPLRDARTCHLLFQAAQALAEAHDKGLVHRDVKPSNIMVCRRGGIPDMVKVLDFGLVKSVETAGPDNVTRLSALTQAATIVGTPHYMSPEAIRGQAVGPGADVYALGAVGYFLLTGRELFPGTSAIETLANHLSAEPPFPVEINGRPVDAGLEGVLQRCLAKDASLRFQDGRDLALALSSLRLEGWADAQARVWWDDFYRQPRPAATASPMELTQLSVDIRSREATTGAPQSSA